MTDPAQPTGEGAAPAPSPSEEPSGERLLPDVQRDRLIYAEHIVRYRLAALLAPGRRIIDAACGEGYGAAHLLASGAAAITGVDVDQPTIATARQRYPGVSFTVADVRQLPFEEGSFDLAVSFETLEHVERPEDAVAELRRVLEPEGTLIASSPNIRRHRGHSDYHVREFTPDEFEALLAPHFDSVTLLEQDDWITSAVAQSGGPFGAVDSEVGTPAEAPLFVVAVCGNEPFQLHRPIVQMSGIFEAHEIVEQLHAWQRRAEIAETQLLPWQERARIAEELLAPWQDRARKAEDLFFEARATIDRMEASKSWRITKPLRGAASRVSGRDRGGS